MSQITLAFNGTTTTLIPDESGRYNLNVLRKAAGNLRRHEVRNWLNNQSTQDLCDEYSTTGNSVVPLVSVNGGRNRGTYAIKELVFAYASWISSEFHKAVLDSFTAAVSGDGRLAVDIATRAVSVDVRKKAMAAVNRATGGHGGVFREVTNATYETLFGGSASELRSLLNLKAGANVRQNLSEEAVKVVTAAEALACLDYIAVPNGGDMSLNAAREAAIKSSNAILSYTGVSKFSVTHPSL